MIVGFIIGSCFGFLLGIVLSAWCCAMREKDDAAKGYIILCGDLYRLDKYIGGEDE